MDDLISRQVAINDIETVNPFMPLSINWVKNWVKALPPARPELYWIPCSERLPEELTTVLITDKDGDVFVARFIEIINGCAEWSTDDVIAWMPLPKPY